MNGEKRRSPRRALRYPAQIDFCNGSASIDCALSDISTTGARVLMPRGQPIPEQIELLFGARQVRRRCQVAWRTDSAIGLEFIKDEKPNGKRPPRRSVAAKKASAKT